MGRQKAQVNARRELRKETRKGRARGNEEVTHLHPAAAVERIGMAKERVDRSVIQPRSANQALYMDALKNSTLVVSTGSAGSGKTLLATAHAIDELVAKNIEKIVVTRPMVSAEEEMGYLPGDVMSKFLPYFRPVYDILKKRMGASFLQYCLRPEIEKIEVAPFAFMRGRTFDNAVVILDEAQNVTVMQMRMFITRLGENTTCIINGDVDQCDLPKHVKSGLVDLIERIERKGVEVPVIKFTEEDSVRSPNCSLGLALYND